MLKSRGDLTAAYLFPAAGWVSMMHAVCVNSDRLRRSPVMTEMLSVDTYCFLGVKWW